MKRSTGIPASDSTDFGRDLRAPARWINRAAAVVLVGFVVAACSSSSATPTAAPTAAPVATPAPTTAPTDTSAPIVLPSLATGVPTAIDPCQLITSQEASALAGATFGAGVESTNSGGGKMCTYGGQTLNVFEVTVGQAPDLATAQAGKAAAIAAIQAEAGKAIQFTEAPSLGDGAAYFSGSVAVSGQTFSGSALYGLKGLVFYGFSDLALGQAPLTSAAMLTEAQTILSRLP